MQNSTPINNNSNQISNLDYIAIEPQTNANACIIWLHGLGACGDDLKPLANSLQFSESCAIRHIIPHAPSRPITLNQGMVMPAWFDIDGAGVTAKEDEAGVKQSQQAIVRLIDAEVNRGIDPQRIILAGFSQGGAMALYAGVNYPKRLGGLVALSAFLPLKERKQYNASVHTDMPIFMAGGEKDQLVLLKWSFMSKQALSFYGFKHITWHSYPIEHCISSQEVTDLGQWLQEILS
ncbi:MAG: alpha/beta hydrolase-fold protein [Gammaproteobacteria bacterium]